MVVFIIATASAARPTAVTSKGSVGRGESESTPRNTAVISRPRGWLATCPVSSVPRSALALERVTIRAAAIEITKLGIWLVSPSPMVSLVKTSAVWPAGQPFSIMPTANPPAMLIAVMRMPATASPRTNLLAPSIAP